MKQTYNGGYLNPRRHCPHSMSRWEEKSIFSTQREVLALLTKIDSYRINGEIIKEAAERMKEKQEIRRETISEKVYSSQAKS
jgi:hypothetical protein